MPVNDKQAERPPGGRKIANRGHLSSVQNFLQNAFMAAVGLAGRAWRLRVSASARPARRRQAASA
ncbi:hypothetical protein, partial [Aquibaculum arenosum]